MTEMKKGVTNPGNTEGTALPKEKKTEDIKKEADQRKCQVNSALYYINEFLSGPMCGRCFPCSMGSYEVGIRLENLTSGRGTGADIIALKRIAHYMQDASMCKKGKDTAKFILDWLGSVEEGGKDVFSRHARGGCPSMECAAFIEYRVIPEKCTACGLCQEACKDNAIIGQKRVAYRSGYHAFEIRQKRCTKCGECIKVCPVAAIEVIGVSTEKGAAAAEKARV